MILRNFAEKLIKKLYNNIQKEIYLEEINNMDIGKKEEEFLFEKIDLLFSNFVSVNKKIKTILINNFNNIHKQKSFNNRQIDLLNDVSSENDINDKNNSITKSILQLKHNTINEFPFIIFIIFIIYFTFSIIFIFCKFSFIY